MQPFTFFVSYRRQDTAPIALLLKHEIEARLQFVHVVVDVQQLAVGDHFPDSLRRLIDGAHATIVLIGKQWMPRRPEGVQREGDDWVCNELDYSNKAPLIAAEGNRFGLTRRCVIPVFADCEPNFSQFVIPRAIDFVTKLQGERIDYAAWPTAIGPLIDRIAIKLGLERRPDKDKYPTPDPAIARTQPVSDQELATILSYDDYEGWYVDNFGSADVRYLVKTFEFPDFNRAADFMRMVSDHCRVLDHHPEWRNVFKHVMVSLTTWDAQRKVTIYDMNLALYMNMAARAVLKERG